MTALIFLAAALAPAPAPAAELTLRFLPSPREVAWKSPRTLSRSIVLNSFWPTGDRERHSIGHVSVAVACADGSRFAGAVTSAGGDAEDRRLLLRKRAGLELLFHAFDGRLETAAEVEADWSDRARRGHGSFLKATINEEACARLIRYAEAFRDEGIWKRYGLPFRPLHREGAGCTAFAVSFLEQTGALAPASPAQAWESAWRLTVRAPESLIGGTSLIELLFGRPARRWARPDEPGREVTFYDADRMHRWAVAHATPGARDRRARGVEVDLRAIPAPEGDLWKTRENPGAL